jgi:hypothetical protein
VSQQAEQNPKPVTNIQNPGSLLRHWATVLSGIVRLTLVVAIGVGGWSLVQSFGRTATAPPHEKPFSLATMTTTGTSKLCIDRYLLAPGRWSFGQSTFSLQFVQCAEQEVVDRFQSLGLATLEAGPVSAIERDILSWVQRLAVVAVQIEGYQVYRTTFGTTVGRVVTDGQKGRERLRLAQLAWPLTDGLCGLVELRPLPGAQAPMATASLLPLPSGAEVLARRWDENDQLSAEIVGRVPSLHQLQAEWRTFGWQVKPWTENGELATGAFCQKETTCVHTWSFHGPASEGEYLLMWRSPAGLKENPQPKGRS